MKKYTRQVADLPYEAYIENLNKYLKEVDTEKLKEAIGVIWGAYKGDKKIFIIGNGGSASIASHLACDLVKTISYRAGKRTKAFRAICLTDNVPLITAWSNDVDYRVAYAEQLKALAKKGDILIALSSSGDSQNILECIKAAKKRSMKVVSISGFGGGKLARAADVPIVVNTERFGPTEDIQSIIIHFFVSRLLSMVKARSKKN